MTVWLYDPDTDRLSSKIRNPQMGDQLPPRPQPQPPPNMRLAQNHGESAESRAAHLFRHALKNELNALGLGARVLLLDDELGKTSLSDEGREFLKTIGPLVNRVTSIIDQVRRLPVESAPRADDEQQSSPA